MKKVDIIEVRSGYINKLNTEINIYIQKGYKLHGYVSRSKIEGPASGYSEYGYLFVQFMIKEIEE